MFRLVLSFGLFLTASPALAGENCTCRHQDAEIYEGQTACIRTPKGMKMARCERVLNNTSWKFLNEPCPYANLGVPETGSKGNPEIFKNSAFKARLIWQINLGSGNY